MCQDEKISNWSHRPLRKSQEYYAALDAFSLLKVAEQLADKDPDSVLADKIAAVNRGEGIEFPEVDYPEITEKSGEKKPAKRELGVRSLKIISAINEYVENCKNFKALQTLAEND